MNFPPEIGFLLEQFILILWAVFKSFWWVYPPIFLYNKLEKYYLYWLNWDFWFARMKWIVVEIIPPRDLTKTFKSMEDVIGGLWGPMYYPANWRELWLEGQPQFYGGPLWMTFEIAATGGKIHFYARMPKGLRNNFEATLYAQYPDVEIFEVEDYTQKVPQDIPDKDWDIKGEDYMLLREDAYPIKTYQQFFEPQIGMISEERLIDPIHALMEGLNKGKPGDNVWFQIGLIPITSKSVKDVGRVPAYRGKDWDACVATLTTKLAKRKAPPSPVSAAGEWKKLTDPTFIEKGINQLVGSNPPVYTAPKAETTSADTSLTPGEREALSAVEIKASKRLFTIWIRSVYVCNKNLPYDTGSWGAPRNYVHHLAGYNGLRFCPRTRTKINYFLRDRRLYLRKRQFVRRYATATPPGASFDYWFKGGLLMVMNIEEIATLFHFPAQFNPVGTPRVEFKKSEPPNNLPV